MTLLTISFTSLSWKDTSICQRTASLVCWTLLRQVCHSFRINMGYLPCYFLLLVMIIMCYCVITTIFS